MKKLGFVFSILLVLGLLSACNKEKAVVEVEDEPEEIVEVEEPKVEDVVVEEEEDPVIEEEEEEEPVVEAPKKNKLADHSQVAKVSSGSKYDSVLESFEKSNTEVVEFKHEHSSSNPDGNKGMVVDTEFQGKKMKVFIYFNAADGMQTKTSEMSFGNEADARDYFNKALATAEAKYGKATDILKPEGVGLNETAYWENNSKVLVGIVKAGSEIIVSIHE